MSTTRRALRAQCTRLTEQLAATENESRKVRAARLQALSAKAERLTSELLVANAAIERLTAELTAANITIRLTAKANAAE